MTTQYLDLLARIGGEGKLKGDRTDTGTRSLFGEQLQFDLRDGFPLLTTKRVPFRWVAEELFWFLSGSTDVRELQDRGVAIWDEWATAEQCARFGRTEGDLGPVYGWQWRNFGGSNYLLPPDGHFAGVVGKVDAKHLWDGVDQIAAALDLLQNNPDSRRIIVTGWNPKEATKVTLPPCHTMFQFGTHEEANDTDPTVSLEHLGAGRENAFEASVRRKRRVLSCHMYQRSADVFLGVPFNIASYALLTHMFAHVLDYNVGTLTISFGDVHIYSSHREQVEEQLMRQPLEPPRLTIQHDRFERGSLLSDLLAINYDSLKLEGYKPHKKIPAPVSV